MDGGGIDVWKGIDNFYCTYYWEKNVVIRLVLSTVFEYSWIISIIACLFMKEYENE